MSEFAKVDCLSTVYPIGEGWVGKSKSGEVKFFKSLQDYKTYLTNLASSGRICSCRRISQASSMRILSL